MPLLTPGLNEATVKTLTKRLHKSLKAQQGTPTLTQLQTLMAQAMGHQDWHAARLFWESPPPPARQPKVEDKYADEAKDRLQACRELLQLASESHMNSHVRAVQGQLSKLGWILQHHGRSYHAEKLLQRAEELQLAEGEPQQQHCERLERLVIRTQIELWDDIGDGDPLPVLPVPSAGIDDEDVSDPPPLTAEEEAAREEGERLYYEEWAEEDRKERNKQQPLADQILLGLQQCVASARSGSDSFLESLQDQIKRMKELHIGIYYYPDEALNVAERLTHDGSDPTKRMKLLDRLELCQRRIQASILKYFFPERSREKFLPAWQELLNGATLIGHWELMEQALELSEQVGRTFDHRSYEEADAVRLLCQWWNAHAPQGQREAAAFFVGVLISDMVQYLGYDECPRSFPHDFSQNNSYAFFPSPRGFCYVVQFVQGADKQTRSELGVTTYQANGQEMWIIGTNRTVDDSHYAIDGLHALKSDYQTRFSD